MGVVGDDGKAKHQELLSLKITGKDKNLSIHKWI
jgi:hypothetical protein